MIPASQVPGSKTGASKLILVVDDDPAITSLYNTSLSRQGFRVVVAPTGEKAMETLRTGFPVSLIILDLMLPGMGGFEVLKKIQEMGRSIPVFVVTSRILDDNTFRDLSLATNVQGVYQKPLDLKSFHKIVHALLGTKPPPAIDWQD